MSEICNLAALPVGLGLTTAVFFAFGVQLMRIGLRYTDSLTATMVSIATSAALYWLFAPFFVEASYWLSPAVLLFAAIGLFRPLVSANLGSASTKLVGPTIASTLAATSPLFGALFGIVVFGERMSLALVAGTLGVVAGIMMLSWRGGAGHDWPRWALLLPVAAAVLRVLAHVLAKIGMEILPSPYFVGLVGYSVSLVAAVTHHRFRRRTGRGRVRRGGLKWIVGTGIAYGLAILSLNTALHCGQLVVVLPVAATTPLFAMLLGAYLFGESSVGARGVLGVILVVLSVILVLIGQ